jgi:hypothetical protein
MLEKPADQRLERRYLVERRLLTDRRSGLDRRIGPRRFHVQWVDIERRIRPDGRRPVERRCAAPRRRWMERRRWEVMSAEPSSI